jgi:hypothetical protein
MDPLRYSRLIMWGRLFEPHHRSTCANFTCVREATVRCACKSYIEAGKLINEFGRYRTWLLGRKSSSQVTWYKPPFSEKGSRVETSFILKTDSIPSLILHP